MPQARHQYYPTSPSDRPMSWQQQNMIEHLLRSRRYTDDMTVEDQISLLREKAPTMSLVAAGKMIKKLKASPIRDPGYLDQVTEGYYLVDEDVYQVRRSPTSGHLFAAILPEKMGSNFKYVPGGMRRVFEHGTRLTLEKAQELGVRHTRCMLCGKRLTKPESIERGIGPDCRRKLQ